MSTTWKASHIQFLTHAELRAFFRVITRKRARALFLLVYRHGLRASEVGQLQVDDLNLAQQRVTIRRHASPRRRRGPALRAGLDRARLD